MTREQEAITYFEGLKKRLEDFRKIYPSPDTVGYQATTKEISFYDMALSALSTDNTMEWLEDEDGSYECSKCHVTRSGLISGAFNFCPNCGRKVVQK